LALIASFGLAALIVALGFFAVYTYRSKYKAVIVGSGALALAVMYAVIAFNEHNPRELFQAALWAAPCVVIGLRQFREYWRKMNGENPNTASRV